MCTKGYDLAVRFIEPKKQITKKYNKLQKQEISKENISKLNFTKTLYKTATEILLQANQTYKEKYIEWFEINREHNGLVENRIIFENKIDFVLKNSETYGNIINRIINGEEIDINEYPEYLEYLKNLAAFNKKGLEQEEEIYKEFLLIDKAIEEGKFKIITSL